MLLEWAWRVADKEHWEEECRYLRGVFRKNGFSTSKINRTFALFDPNKRRTRNESEEEPTRGGEVLPILPNMLTHRLQHKQLRTISYPYRKLKQCLRSLKDLLSMNVPGVYKVPCECRTNYIGQQVDWFQ